MTRFADSTTAAARPESIIRGKNFRFTVLSSRLIRIEWSASGHFVDAPTPMVINRDFETPELVVNESAHLLEIRTEHLYLSYNKLDFTPAGLSIALRQRAPSSHLTTWHYGDQLPYTADSSGNLGGTARTLDNVDGACELETGILARYGFAVLDDSASVEIGPDGWVAPRPSGGEDFYFFGHGLDFRAALADFHRLTGPVPLVPRRVLGNWWSRFWRYSDHEYLELMDRFTADGIPFSVAVLDMDWHLVDIDPRLGNGWTGYTWNHELFPDPEAFLTRLRERGRLVTLNLHPADGVRAHEQAYPAMAAELGVDPATEVAIPFDVTSREFIDAYLRLLHHPLEAQGVDFWWLDWQSGGVSRIAGLDPLWMLNHIHFHDSGRNGARPLTFSRYAGLGSHRYPIGFSGDTVTTWESLDFQPFFTATAANVGYTWWSHDIGGHFGGVKNNELALRWLQFGVFSPINRLHSSMDPFNSKDPAQYPADFRDAMTRLLRLRHALVPYTYTAAWDAHTDGIAVVRPMYHDHPQSSHAYTVPNQYYFGSDIIVAPITTPTEPASGLATVTTWLPEGSWHDLFTGHRYKGNRQLVLHRPMQQIPVLVREGAAIPLLDDPLQDIGANPQSLILRIAPGDGDSVIHEDTGQAAPTHAERISTRIHGQWHPNEPTTFTMRITTTGGSDTTGHRDLIIDLAGTASIAAVQVNDTPLDEHGEILSADGHLAPALRIPLGTHDLIAGVDITFTGVSEAPSKRREAIFTLLHRAEIRFDTKNAVHHATDSLEGIPFAQFLDTLPLPTALRGALIEVSSDTTYTQ